MLSASSGVRISSKSEKSEMDKSSIVVFRPRGIVDGFSVDVTAVMNTFPNGDIVMIQASNVIPMARPCAVWLNVLARLSATGFGLVTV
jgi:hypothetical protein